MKYRSPERIAMAESPSREVKGVMFVEANKFLETMRMVKPWMSLGGKSEKLEKSTKTEFEELKKEAYQEIDKRENLLLELGFSFIALLAVFVANYKLVNLVKLSSEAVPFGIVIFVGALMIMVVIATRWSKVIREAPRVKLNEWQEMLYEDIVYILNSPWMRYLDWTFEQDKAEEAWLKCLRNMAAEIKGLEHKMTLPDYPGKFDDEQNLDGLRVALSEHFRILKKFKIVSVEKVELFKIGVS